MIIGFWLIGGASLLFSGNLGGLTYLLRYMFYSSAVWLGYALVKSRLVDLKAMIYLEVFIGLGLAILGFGQLMVWPDISFLSQFGYDPHQNRLVSTFLDPNYLGVFLDIALFLSIYLARHNRSWKILIVSFILLAGIVLTYSRSAYLMLLVGGLMMSAKYYKWGILVLAGLVISLYLLVPQFATRINGGLMVDKSASERLDSWQKGLVVFEGNPILGVGFGNLRDYLNDHNMVKVFSEDGGNSGNGIDSSFLLVLAMTGVIGLIVYLGFWVYLVRLLISGDDFSFILLTIVVSGLIGSQFINSLFYPPIMLGLFLLIGGRLAVKTPD